VTEALCKPGAHVDVLIRHKHLWSRDAVRPSFAGGFALFGAEGAGKAGRRLGTRGPLCAAHLETLHSGIQVRPNARPSLRDGLTAYAALSSATNSLCHRRLAN